MGFTHTVAKRVLARLRAELLDLLARGLGLEQGVVDAAGDLDGVGDAREQAEALGPGAHHAAETIGAEGGRRRVAGAGAVVLELAQHRPHHGLDEARVDHRLSSASIATILSTRRR